MILLQLMNLESSQEQCQGGNIWNSSEAKFVANLAKETKRQLQILGERKSIGILTFYNRQKTEIRKHLKEDEDICIRSVDGYQVGYFFQKWDF